MLFGISWTTLAARGPDRLVLEVSAGVRILFGLLAAVAGLVLCYGVLFEGEPTIFLGRNIAPAILFFATLWGAVQEDRWTFDRAAGRVEGRYGLLFLARRRRWPLAEVERIVVDRFTRGSLAARQAEPAASRGAPSPADEIRSGLRPARWQRGQQWVRLLAVLGDGTVLSLDSARGHRLPEFTTRGMRIASLCGAAFSDET